MQRRNRDGRDMKILNTNMKWTLSHIASHEELKKVIRQRNRSGKASLSNP
jgi:hypothetical protein